MFGLCMRDAEGGVPYRFIFAEKNDLKLLAYFSSKKSTKFTTFIPS